MNYRNVCVRTLQWSSTPTLSIVRFRPVLAGTEVDDERLGKVSLPGAVPKLSRTPGQVRHTAHGIAPTGRAFWRIGCHEGTVPRGGPARSADLDAQSAARGGLDRVDDLVNFDRVIERRRRAAAGAQ